MGVIRVCMERRGLHLRRYILNDNYGIKSLQDPHPFRSGVQTPAPEAVLYISRKPLSVSLTNGPNEGRLPGADAGLSMRAPNKA